MNQGAAPITPTLHPSGTPFFRRILVVKLSSLGDLFHALPAVHLIKEQTGASMDWVAHDMYADLVRCFTDVDRVIAFPRKQFWSRRGPFLADLKAQHYDLVLDMQGLLKSALVARAARAKRRVGPSFSREGARLLYDELSGPTDKARHAVEENLDTVRHLGLAVNGIEFPVVFPRTPLDAGRPRVALLPCSRRPEKNWPAARFVELARDLRTRSGASILLLGSPADGAACAGIERGIGSGVTNLCGRTTLVELGSLLQEVDLLVTVDSGPMHVAAALGTPVVAVFGPTDPVRTGPYGDRHRVVRAAGNLADLPAEAVIPAAVEQLAGLA